MYKGKFNKTKIVATIGPATNSEEMLRKIIFAGVDVCRLNFSHGSHEVHQEVIDRVRHLNKTLGCHVALLQDLQGPKLRIGKVDGEILLEEGKTIRVSTVEQISTTETLFVSYPKLIDDCKPGESILLNDGKVALIFTKVIDDQTMEAEVVAGGVLSSNKGFNLPNSKLSVPSLTEKDLTDLEYGISQDLDWVALSFVRTAEDIVDLKRRISEKGASMKVIAKIEKPEALENIDDIIKVSDGIMVARGDLAVEVPLQKVPLIQKDIVEKCLASAKPVIIATQMMETMITDSMPTRAEITDVANAVLDGADALMLSAETSVGKYPLKVIDTMSSIIAEIENDRRAYFKGVKPNPSSPSFASDEVCFTAVRMSDHLNAKAIVAMTKSGYTGYKVASFRPQSNVYIFTDNKKMLTTLNLVWGVRGFYYDKFTSTDDTFQDVVDILKSNDLVAKNDYVVNCASMPIHKKQRTNTIKITHVD